MIRLVPILIFSVLAVMLLAALMQQKPGNAPRAQGPLIGQPMLSLPLSDANSMDAAISTKQLEGKITLINFLASWCAPCEAEMDELMALKKAQKDIQFVGVAWNDAPAKIQPWLKKHGNPFDLMRYDPGGRAAISLGLRGIPETFIIDGKGVVRYQLSGPLTATIRANEVNPLLDELRAEAAHAR